MNWITQILELFTQSAHWNAKYIIFCGQPFFCFFFFIFSVRFLRLNLVIFILVIFLRSSLSLSLSSAEVFMCFGLVVVIHVLMVVMWSFELFYYEWAGLTSENFLFHQIYLLSSAYGFFRRRLFPIFGCKSHEFFASITQNMCIWITLRWYRASHFCHEKHSTESKLNWWEERQKKYKLKWINSWLWLNINECVSYANLAIDFRFLVARTIIRIWMVEFLW